MANPWEFNWQWDDLDPTPEAPKPVTTRQQLASKSARANDPWTMNFDFGRAEASAGAQDYDRLNPMTTVGDKSAASYVQQEEYQMPELLHEEESQRDFIRPKGEMFHARSYVPGAVPEQRVITDRMEPWEVFLRSAARGGEDVVQTGYAMAGGDPRDIPTMPLTYLDNPMTVEAAWDDPGLATEQAAGMIIRMWPMIAAGVGGAAAGASGAVGVAGTEILGSAAGAMAATFAQSMGPRFKQMLMQYPDDPERAWQEAGNATLIDVGATGIGGLLIGVGPLGTSFKQAMFQTFGLRPMAELTGRQLAGNLAIQTLGIQPIVGIANMQAVDAYLGQDSGLTIGDEYLNNLAPSLVQTGAELVGRQAMAPFAKKTAPGGTPGGAPGQPPGKHFMDSIEEASELEKLAADLRTSPEIAAQIPEGLKYQIDQGEDPFKGYRNPQASLNSTLRSRLKETLQTFPEGEKKTGEQWYNTLRNAGVKEEELSDYGLDQMLNTNHPDNKTRLWSVERILGQFHANDYPIAMRELVPERYAGGTDNAARFEPIPGGGFESLSTPGIGEYRENLFVLGKEENTSLGGFAQKRGIDLEALRHDSEAGFPDAEAKMALLRQEHKAFNDFLKKNPEWKSKHARGESIKADHWPHDEYGNVMMHTRTGELKFGDDITTHHIDEIQADEIQSMEGDIVRDMPHSRALVALLYAEDEFAEKLAAERLGDMSYIDDSLRPGVDISAKFDTLLESLGVQTDKPYAWLTEARDRLIKFHDDPGSFSPKAQHTIRSIIDPDRLPSIIDKMRKDSARAQELVNEVLQVKNYANSPASIPMRKSWSKAGLKAEIERALSLGKKFISWTSGRVQMDRNDTGHRIGSLSAGKVRRGEYTIQADGLHGKELLHRRNATVADAKKLLGSDLASKLLKKADESESGWAELTQEEIGGATLGGAFHRKLYDERMVNWAREIGKKFGKKPELKTYDAPNGTEHEMWVMELDPRMSGTMYRYQVADDDADPKNLVAVRQMSVDALRKAMELGGIPMPSVAIIDKRNGLSALSSFSDDITLVASKEMVDPSTGARVFDSDIYSPGTPASRYVVDPVSRTKLSKGLDGIAKEVKAPSLTDEVIKKVGESGLIALSEAHAVVMKFARDIGWLKKGETVMNSDGNGVTKLREWAQGHADFRGWLNTNFGKLITSKKALSRKRSDKTERLSPFTLEAMLRIMESRPLKGGNTRLDSVAYFRGLSAKELGSIDQIKSESGKLIPREKSEELFNGLQDDFDRSIEYLSRRAAEWEGKEYDAETHRAVAQKFLKEVLQSNGSAKRIGNVFDKANANDIHDAKELIKRFEGAATSYFEAKVPGIVSFDKWVHVIVRADRVSPEDIQALRDSGVGRIDVVRGDDETVAQMRDLIINGLDHLHFQADAEPADKTVMQTASGTRKVTLTKKQEKQYRNLLKNLISEIKRINPLADPRFFERLIGFAEDGTAFNVGGISSLLGIAVNVGRNKDAMGSARHEASHTVMYLMDSLKAWKKGEREALVEWFQTKLAKKHEDFLKFYKPEDQFEEAIVQEIGVNRNKWKGYPQAVRNALYRIEGILRAIRTAFKRAFGRKLNPEDIAAMLDAGIMARRAARKLKRLQGKTRGPAFAKSLDGSMAYQIGEESLKDFALSSQLDNTLYGKIDNPAIGTKLKKGTGSQWRAELIKQGVKLEELKDSGLDAFLTDRANATMTLQDVISEREARRVELHVVMADDGGESYMPKVSDGEQTPAEKEIDRLRAEFDGLDLRRKVSEVTGREMTGNLMNWLRNRVMDRVGADALEVVRANPELFERPSDPRHPVYIIDREGEVRGRVVMRSVSTGKSTDLGWMDPINHRYGGRERRSKEVHRKLLEENLQKIKSDFVRLIPRQDEHDIIIPIKPHDGTEFYYYAVKRGDGTTEEVIEGDSYNGVVTAVHEYLAKQKVEFSFEYEPIDTSIGRYRAFDIRRGQHELTSLAPELPYDRLMQAVSEANARSEQRWLERTSQDHAAKMGLDGEHVFNKAVEAMRDVEGVNDSNIEELYPSIAYSLASRYRSPDSMNAPYPHLDTDSFNRLRELESAINNRASGGSDLRFASWTLPDGNFKREYLVIAPDLKRNPGEAVSTHFNDYENKNVIAHLRLAEFHTRDGEVMNMSDEFQSDVMQRASEAREQLIKEYGFTPRPDLGFGLEASNKEYRERWEAANVTAQESRNIFQNSRAMVRALQDQVEAISTSGDFGGQAELFSEFGKYLIDPKREAALSSSLRAPHLATYFLNQIMSYVEGDLGADSGKSHLSTYFVEAFRDVYEGPSGDVDGQADTRNELVRRATEFMRAVKIPPDKALFPGVDNMYDAFRVGLKTVRPMTAKVKANAKTVRAYANGPNVGHGLMIAPEGVPHKKSWGLLTFKIALVDAVRRGHKWIGFTTGQQQNDRYRSALQKAVERTHFKKTADDKVDVRVVLRRGDGERPLNNMTRSELARYIGKDASNQIFDHPDASGTLEGDNIRFNLPGVMDHYDRGIPKEIKPLTDKLKMKLESTEIGVFENGTFYRKHEVHGLRITPEAEAAAKSGEIYRYQVTTDDLSGTLESQLDTALMPDSPARTKLKKGTGAQWRAELTKQGVRLEELRDSGLDEYFTDNKDTQLSLDQVFQYRQGNRIDIVMKVLDDGTQPLVARKKEVKVIEPDAPFDWEDKLNEINPQAADRIKERLDEDINTWINEDGDFDSTDNPRYPFEVRQRQEIYYELVEYNPDGSIEDYIDNYDGDERAAHRVLKRDYGNGEKKYVADKASLLGSNWVVVIRDDWGDGDVVETISADSEDDAVSQADEYIEENSPYYGVSEGETDDWGVYDTAEDRWEETGLTRREAERSSSDANNHHFDSWWENANNEAWEILRGDPDRMIEMYEQAAEGYFSRAEFEEIKETPGYEEAIRQYIASEWRIGGGGGGPGKPRKTDSTKFSNWVLRGGRYYREYVLAVPDMSNDGIDMRTHFNSVTRNILAHFRANDFQTEDGGVALVAQEFQSDVHQDASDVRQTLIKKLGFEPSPTLGYGDSFTGALQEKAAPIRETRDALEQNLEQMQVTIANAFAKRIPEIIDIIGLGAFTKTGEPDPTKSDMIEPQMRQLLARLVSDRPGGRSTTETLDNLVWSLYFFRGEVNVQTFSGKIIDALNKLPAASNVFPGAQSMHQELRFAAKQMKKLRKDLLKKREEANEIVSLRPAAPERLPFKQSWGLLEFKILLHEAIRNGYDWFAMTTGDQQVERYGTALKDAIKNIKYDINRETGKADIAINLNGKSEPHKMSGVTESELARYIGKQAASDVFNSGSNKGTMDASGVTFKSPGIINHYDRTIPSDTKKFLAALDMKWEPLDIGSVTRTTSAPAPKQEWRLIQRGTRPDGTVQEATVVRDTREAIETVMNNANRLFENREALLRDHGYTDYSHELIEPEAANLPAPTETVKFNKAHTVHGIRISEKARMWIQGSPEQPTKRFLKYQVETPDHANDPIRGGELKPGDVNTPEFRSWFKSSAATDKDGRPLRLYRGTQKVAKPTGFGTRKATVSFTPDPYVASVYTQGPWGSVGEGASMYPVYMSIQKPLDMRAITEHATLAEIIDLLPWDFTKNYGEGKVLGLMDLAEIVASLDETVVRGGAKYKVDATTADGVHSLRSFEELSDEISSLDADEMTEADQEALWNMLYDTALDTYAIADDQSWKDMLETLGFDGIIHKDPFVGGFGDYKGDKSLFETGHDDDPIHDTYRPFRQEQIKSVHNRGTWSNEEKDIRYQVDHHDTPEFKRFFGKSYATEDLKPGGKPIELYRGEHGKPDGRDIQNRLPSITLTDDVSIANLYAEEPNDRRFDGSATAPRVGKYYARIENPLFVEKDDPFAELGPLAKKLGISELVKVINGSRRIENAIRNTSVWDEKYSDYGSVRELLNDKPDAINDLYAQSNIILDNADFVELAKSKGYDGAIHLGWSAAKDAVEYRVFDQGQLKSAIGNPGTYDPNDPRVAYQIELPEGFLHADPAVNTPRFKVWFKKSKIVDALGHPLRVFHGSMKNFTKFSKDAAYGEGFLGRRFYFTDHPDDASDNYANRQGPDIRAKLGKYLDEDPGAIDNDFWSQMDNQGVVYPVYLSIQNPVTIGGAGQTRFAHRDLMRLSQAVKHAEGLVTVGDGHGKLSEVLQEIALDVGQGDWIDASELLVKMREEDRVYDIIDENGNSLYAELFRQGLETLGYDGVIDRGVNSRWPWIKPQDVSHYIAFRPNQIKSVFNRGTWSSRLEDIRYQVGGDDYTKRENFRQWLGDGLLKTADGEPIPVFHATGADFDRFRRNPDDIGFHFGTAGQANERYLIKADNADANSDDKFRPNIMKLYSNIKNPFTLKDNSGWDTDMIYRQLFAMFADGDPRLPFTIDELNAFARKHKDDHGDFKPRSLHHLKKLFVSKGYDSIVYYNEYEKEGWIAAQKAYEAAVENHHWAVQRARPGQNPRFTDPTVAPAEWGAVLHAKHVMMQAKEQKVPSYIAFYPNQLKSVFNTGSWSLKKRHLRYQTEWEDAPQSSDFLDSLREGFGGQWENLDEDVHLSSDEADLKRVYRKDWLDMRRGPSSFQFALMYRGRPIGRMNGVINGDTARLNWIGIIGGDEGLGDGAVRHLGAMLRLALSNDVRVLTGLRKGPQEAYAAEEQKAAPQPKPSGGTKVRTPGGSQDDPLIDYYRNLGRF